MHLLISANAGYISSRNARIFNVQNYVWLKPTVRPGNAIYSNVGYGPTFGSGHDLYIANNAGKSRSSYSNLGYAYKTPTKAPYSSTAAKSMLAGSYNFLVSEYEVYYLGKYMHMNSILSRVKPSCHILAAVSLFVSDKGY